MERLIQQFEQPVVDADGVTYRVSVFGRSRPADTWQGWLVFERLHDGQRFATAVETTQSSADGLLYWATGLSNAYFGGALRRATTGARTKAAPVAAPPPLVGGSVDSEERQRRLADIERDVLATFDRRGSTQLLTQTVLDDLPYAHADVVRALEDLQQKGGFLVRRTEEGNDWLFLTGRGTAK